MPNSQFFRAGVGAVIVNDKGEVLAFERKDTPGAWQFPQGGIDEKEDPIDAVYREVEEETGIEHKHLTLIRECQDWLSYELPHEYRGKKSGRGQTQRWFLFKCRVEHPEIELTAGDEFIDWQWIRFCDLIERTAPFRKEVYGRLLTEFDEPGNPA